MLKGRKLSEYSISLDIGKEHQIEQNNVVDFKD